jgi:hypothetical protein
MAHLSFHTTTLVPTAGHLMVSQFTQTSTLIVLYVTHGHQEMVQNTHPRTTRL